MSREATWTNSDGLVVGFGVHTIDNDVPAVTGTGSVKTMVVEILDATTLEATSAVTTASIPPQAAVIPRGSRILEASFQVKTAFAGATANLDIGTHSLAAVDDDPNGIDVAVDVLVLDAVGAVVACDGALVGGVTSCGAVSTSDVVVTFSYDTAAFSWRTNCSLCRAARHAGRIVCSCRVIYVVLPFGGGLLKEITNGYIR
jgi:hypothetical protein